MEWLDAFVRQMPATDIPPDAMTWSARMLLDTLGICIASTPMEAGMIARDTAAMLYGASTPGTTATLLFDGRKASCAGAAFAAATQIDNLDGHDGYSPSKGHIGVAAVPALCVTGESMADLSGLDALAALVIGYEVAGRAGVALHGSVSDYHTSGAWNALGVAAIAARLRGVSREQLRHALGIAEYHGPRSQMMREIANPTMLHDGSGQGALVGMSAVIMAELGFTGAPAVTIEAVGCGEIWSDLGEDWQMTRQYIKPYPVCRWAHAPIDAVRRLCKSHRIDHRDISKLRISSFSNAVALNGSMPATTSIAQYSLAFPVATMAVHGRIGLEHISGRGLSDPDVARLVERTEARIGPEHEARFPEGRWADVTVALSSGQELHSGAVNARGGPEDPFDEAQIVEKFLEFSTPVIGECRSFAIRDAVLGLVEQNSRFRDLSVLLADPP